MTHPGNADSIEAEIERDRASLASTLDALQDRFSVEHIAEEALGLVKTNAAAYTRSIDEAIRANPMALAITGVGLAWLIFGGEKKDDDPTVQAMNRRQDEGGAAFPGATPPMARAVPHQEWSTDDEWLRDIDTHRDRANSKIRQIEADAKSHAAQLREGAAEGVGKARDFTAERAAVLGDFAEEMKRSFRKGLDDLSESGREQIVAAREHAYSARIRAERVARGGTREAGRLIEEHPLVVGVVALAAGAAFAAMLPQTRVENRTFGAESDRLMEQANRLLRQERERVGRVASGVAEDLKSSARSAAKAVAEDVKDAGRSLTASASEPVAEAADSVKDRTATQAQEAQSEKPLASSSHRGTGTKS